MAELKSYDVRFKPYSKYLLCGSSRSGKTTFVYKMLKYAQEMFVSPPSYTLFYYAAWQDLYAKMSKEQLVQEWKNECPDNDYIIKLAAEHKVNGGGLLVVIDDLLSQIGKDTANLFQVFARHNYCSVIFLSQSLYVNDINFRDMRTNSDYIVLFKPMDNRKQYRTYFNDIDPVHYKALADIFFKKITALPYSYLLYDKHPDTPDEIRFRSNIFPDEPVGASVGVQSSVSVYVPPR
jgi:hypothetical protein